MIPPRCAFLAIKNLGLILEFKQVFENEKPETVLEWTLLQIRGKHYVAELEAAGVTDILQLAEVFRGKEIWEKRLRKEMHERLMAELRRTGDPRVTGDGKTFERSPYVDTNF